MWKGNDARKCIRNSLRTRVMRAATIALSALILSTACARVAAAAPGDCAAPTAADRLINSTQCLFILKAAVGTETCPTPVCSCDPSGDGIISASDALRCLKAALGIAIVLACPPPCGVTGDCDAIELIVQSGSDLDSGWKGPGHDADIIAGASVTFEILSRCSNDQSVCDIDADCTGGSCEATCDCGAGGDTDCEISGPTGSRACIGDTSLPCSANSDCNDAGAVCVPFFGPPLPLAASGTPVCVTTYFARDFSGTIDVAAGDISASAALRSRVHLGSSIQTPCPSCGGSDVVIGEQALCIGGPHNGASCTVEGVSPQFGGVSSDCPPDRTANVSGAGLNVVFSEFTTSEVNTTATQTCGFPFDGIHPSAGNGACLDDFSSCASNDDCSANTICGLYCHCGFCDAGVGPDPDLPCMGNADCPAGSVCATDPQASNKSQAQPNGCASLLCGEVNEEQCCSIEDGEACASPTNFDGECNVHPSACSTDQECIVGGNGDTCIRSPRSCFGNTISRSGSAQPFGSYCIDDPEVAGCTTNADCNIGACAAGSSEPVAVALFCIPATASTGINSAAGLPGPAALSLRSVVRILGAPSANGVAASP